MAQIQRLHWGCGDDTRPGWINSDINTGPGMDSGYNRTLFTYEFAEELVRKAGFRDVCRVGYHQTTSPHDEIVELDNRKDESFYLEAYK